jgi:hypothetical protein
MIFQPVPATSAQGRLLLARRLRVFRGGHLELPFQRQPWRSVHGTPHAKGMAQA